VHHKTAQDSPSCFRFRVLIKKHRIDQTLNYCAGSRMFTAVRGWTTQKRISCMEPTKISRLKRESNGLYEPKSGNAINTCSKPKGASRNQLSSPFFFRRRSSGASRTWKPSASRSPPSPARGPRTPRRGSQQPARTRPGPRDQIDSTSDRETRTAAHEPPARQPSAVRSPPPSIVATVRKGKESKKEGIGGGVAWGWAARGID